MNHELRKQGTSAPQTPPLRWFLGTADQRRQAWHYWVRDTAVGLLNTGIHFGFRLIAIDLCSWFGSRMGALAQRRYRANELLARELWRRVRPQDADPARLDATMKLFWRDVGRSLTEFSVLDKMWEQGRIAVNGAEVLSAARAAGRRVIVIAVHLSNWEAIGRTLIGLGYKGAAIYQVPTNRFEHNIVISFRTRYGGVLVPQGSAGARAAYRTLFDMDGLLLWVDECAAGHVNAPAFGRPLPEEGNIAFAARLAVLADAELVPAYCVRSDHRAQLTVNFLPALDLVRSGGRRAGVAANIARINAAIEPLILQHLEQWYYASEFRLDSRATQRTAKSPAPRRARGKGPHDGGSR